MSAPIIYLTNWASAPRRDSLFPSPQWGPKYYPAYTIMAAPRVFEVGQGFVTALIPDGALMRAAKAELAAGPPGPAAARYRAAYEARLLASDVLGPGALVAVKHGDTDRVTDGSKLCCSCSRAAAAAGFCHRAWAAPILARVGWRVILDGVEVT